MVINIATSTKDFRPGEIIMDNNQFFDNNVIISCLESEELTAMKMIDQAELVDKKTGNINTPYGSTDISNLSLGCKTVINYIWTHKHPEKFEDLKAIWATEAGYNALEVLFEFLEIFRDEKTIIVIEHDDGLYQCKDRAYRIDNQRVIYSMFDF